VHARGGRHAGRGSGLGLDAIAHDGGHRMLAAHPAGQAARVPRRLPAVTLTVIPPAAHPRYAQAARAQSPPAPAPACATTATSRSGRRRPHRRPGSAADHRPTTADAGALAPGGVPARDGAAPSLAGSHSGGPARACCRRGGSPAHCLRPGAAAPEPGPCSAGPPIIAADIPAVAGVPALARRSCRVAWSRVQLGTLDVAGGQLAGARALRDEALDLSLAIHINRNMALCLVAFAGWRSRRAARSRRRCWPGRPQASGSGLGGGRGRCCDQGRPTWWPRSARRRARSGSTRHSPRGSRLSQREAVAAIRGRRRTGTRRPDPRPGLSRSSPTRPP
jgi:hypothetical protein